MVSGLLNVTECAPIIHTGEMRENETVTFIMLIEDYIGRTTWATLTATIILGDPPEVVIEYVYLFKSVLNI